MDVRIKCTQCKQSFTIQEEYLADKEKLICPNCSKEFPQVPFNNLKTAIEHLSLAKQPINNLNRDRIDFELIESTKE